MATSGTKKMPTVANWKLVPSGRNLALAWNKDTKENTPAAKITREPIQVVSFRGITFSKLTVREIIIDTLQ